MLYIIGYVAGIIVFSQVAIRLVFLRDRPNADMSEAIVVGTVMGIVWPITCFLGAFILISVLVNYYGDKLMKRKRI